MAKKTDNNKCWQGGGATKTFTYTPGMQNDTITLQDSLAKNLIKLNINLFNDPAIPVLGI